MTDISRLNKIHASYLKSIDLSRSFAHALAYSNFKAKQLNKMKYQNDAIEKIHSEKMWRVVYIEEKYSRRNITNYNNNKCKTTNE